MKSSDSADIKGREPADMLDLIRSLDIIFWSLLGFYFIVISTAHIMNVASFPFLSALPFFCIAWAVFKLDCGDGKSYSINKMRTYALITAFNYPFYIFLMSYDSVYFLVCSFVALSGFYLFLSEFVSFNSELAGELGDEVLSKECSKTVKLLYLSAFLLAAYFMILHLPRLAQLFLNTQIPGIIEILMFLIIMFPLMLPLTLLFRLRQLAVKNFKENVSALND